MSLVGVVSTTDFEVIEVVDETDPYPTLLGIDWALTGHLITMLLLT